MLVGRLLGLVIALLRLAVALGRIGGVLRARRRIGGRVATLCLRILPLRILPLRLLGILALLLLRVLALLLRILILGLTLRLRILILGLLRISLRRGHGALVRLDAGLLLRLRLAGVVRRRWRSGGVLRCLGLLRTANLEVVVDLGDASHLAS